MRPTRLASALRRRGSPYRLLHDLIRSAGRVSDRLEVRAVALTFDDGPRPGWTDQVLDVLAALDVRATFFCVGRNAQAHPDLVTRMAAEGHAVGSHSLTHPHPAETSLPALRRDYASGRKAVADALGADTRLFRPPHGHLSIGSALLLRRWDLRPWLWSVDPEDWHPSATREQVTSVAAGADAGDVVLFHDWVEQPWAPEALDRTATVASLPAVVEAVRRRGLGFRTLDPDCEVLP